MSKGTLVYALAGLALIGCATPSALGSDSQKRPVFSVTDVEEAITRIAPFAENEDEVFMALPDGTRRIVRVALRKSMCKGTLVERTDDVATSKPGSWYRYELEPKDKASQYGWYVWLDNPDAGRFKLFTTPGCNTYLSWVDHWALYFANVSRSMDKSAKVKRLVDRLNGGRRADVQYVPVTEIITREEFVDLNTTAHYVSIYLTSLEEDGASGFRLRLHGSNPSKVYTLVTDKQEKLGWRLQE